MNRRETDETHMNYCCQDSSGFHKLVSLVSGLLALVELGDIQWDAALRFSDADITMETVFSVSLDPFRLMEGVLLDLR